MRKHIGQLATAVILSIGMNQTVFANQQPTSHISWQKSVPMPYQGVNSNDIPNNMASLVFIRPNQNTSAESSANISLNNRYLVSLQGGNYTQSMVCSGPVSISIQSTSHKSNNLLANVKQGNLQPQQTYYFYIDIDQQTQQPSIQMLSESQAQQVLSGKNYQSHQISRIVNHCPQVVQAPMPPVQPEVQTPPPVQQVQQAPSLRLNILFDLNKSHIRPEYQGEIVKAAQFLSHYPNMSAIIEGHTDSRGNDDYNQALSHRRAEAVRSALIQGYGINPARLTAIGYGESRPIADNSTPMGQQENRRVIISIPQQ